jgi:ankyrin repeat protein
VRKLRTIIDAVRGSDFSLFKKILEDEPESVNATDQYGQNTLFICINKKKMKFVKEILKVKNLNINHKDRWGWTALHIACAEGDLPTVKKLIELGADVNAKNDTQTTPIHHSMEKGIDEVTKFLIEKGADVCSEDYFGNSLYTDIYKGKCKIDPQFILTHARFIDEENRKKFQALRLEKLFE